MRSRLTVEHLLPQAWEDRWPLSPDLDGEEAAIQREAALHRFGNLTLLTKKLNPSISNDGWSVKHPRILAHSALALNRRLQGESVWDESVISRRTEELLEVAMRLWPRPG